MDSTKVKYISKGSKFQIENDNMLGDARKKYKELLRIGVMQIYVEISLGKSVPGDKEIKEIVAYLESIGKEQEKQLLEGMADLAKKLAQLQKEEKAGSKKAAAEAGKLVKSHEKFLKDAPSDINVAFRKAAQKAVSVQLKGEKIQLSSVGRSAYRGVFELADDAFEEDGGGEYVPYFNELGKGLADAGKDIHKQLGEEERLRDAVSDELAMLIGKPKDEKGIKKLEEANEKYSSFLDGMATTVKKTDAEVVKLEKLAKSETELKKDRDTTKPLKAFREGIDELALRVKNRAAFMKTMEKAPRGGFSKDELTEFSAKLNKAKPLADIGKVLERAGKDLQEEAKDAAKG